MTEAWHEQRIVEGLRECRADAWRALYDAYAQRIWRLVARLVGRDSAEVADVVQETFLAAARSAGGFDSQRGSLWLWLCGVARNQVALHYRKQQSRARLMSAEHWLAERGGKLAAWLAGNEPSPVETLAAAELALMVRKTLADLPGEYGNLLTAKYLDGTTIAEIAAAQQCSSAAVNSKLARARQAFRRAFTGVSTCCSDS